jgi:hypothetical protein
MAADICVLFSASDAYMRDFRVHVPADCIGSESDDRRLEALTLMERVLKAEISPSPNLKLEELTTRLGPVTPRNPVTREREMNPAGRIQYPQTIVDSSRQAPRQ